LERRDEEMIESIAQVLRDEPMRKPASSFDARVMASIRWSNQPRGARSIAAWFLRPRRISLSPVTAVLAAASVMAVAYFGSAAVTRRMLDGTIAAQSAALSAAASDSQGRQLVQFVLVAPEAKSVSVVGDFNDWNAKATPLSSASGNMWSVEIPLTPGRYNYIFMVDGTRLVPDPAAPRAPVDAFGQPNSVITVGSSSNAP
jgi:hypothetical protein